MHGCFVNPQWNTMAMAVCVMYTVQLTSDSKQLLESCKKNSLSLSSFFNYIELWWISDALNILIGAFSVPVCQFLPGSFLHGFLSAGYRQTERGYSRKTNKKFLWEWRNVNRRNMATNFFSFWQLCWSPGRWWATSRSPFCHTQQNTSRWQSLHSGHFHRAWKLTPNTFL